MNSKEYRELIQAYQNVYEQQIGVPLDKPTDGAAARKLQQMIPKGEKVYIPKSGLQKAHYEPEGEELSENPLASLDKLARGTAQTVGGTIGGIQGQKTGIPGGRIVGGLLGRQKGGQMYDKAKETVGGLLKQSYESEGDLVDGQQDLFDIVKDYLLDEGYVTTEEEALVIMVNISTEQIQNIKEDLEERRKQLMQRQRQQVTASQERVASHQQARKKRIRQQVTASRERAASNEQEKIEKHQRAQEKEQIKNELRNELKKEMRHEAVGDPISPNSVFKLTDKEVQKNLQSTMKPAGPAPMKPTSPKPKQQSSSDRFVKRIVGSTMLSPL